MLGCLLRWLDLPNVVVALRASKPIIQHDFGDKAIHDIHGYTGNH